MNIVNLILQYAFSLIALSSIVIVHELGHFSMAKLSGVHVEEFSIGFGPKIFKFMDKKGTTYAISAVFFGGYNKLLGMNRSEPVPSGMKNKSFHSKPAYKKIIISIGGTLFNIIFALLLIGLFLCFAAPTTTVEYIEPDSPASMADIRVGDELMSIEGEEIKSWNDFVTLTEKNPGKEVTYSVLRQDNIVEIKAKLADKDGEGYLGIAPYQSFDPVYAIKSYGFFGFIGESFKMVWDITVSYIRAFGMLFSGKIPLSEVRPVSPVGIVSVFQQTASMGMKDFIFFVAFISILVGYGNLIPILPLDGGNILFIIIESIRRRPVPQKVIESFNYAGMAVLACILFIALVLDIINPFNIINL